MSNSKIIVSNFVQLIKIVNAIHDSYDIQNKGTIKEKKELIARIVWKKSTHYYRVTKDQMEITGSSQGSGNNVNKECSLQDLE
mmetsp:Transcript_23850/g.27480  ORF Transcript_23850/g.27480 Transcript_23850/m.27480 type:complete len:83 (+) Transcript_23850:21-269(+)